MNVAEFVRCDGDLKVEINDSDQYFPIGSIIVTKKTACLETLEASVVTVIRADSVYCVL